MESNLQWIEPFINSGIFKVPQERLRIIDESNEVISLGKNLRCVGDASTIPPIQVPTNHAKLWLVQKHMAKHSVDIVTQTAQSDKSTNTSSLVAAKILTSTKHKLKPKAYCDTPRMMEDLRRFLGGVIRLMICLVGPRLAEYREPLGKEMVTTDSMEVF